MRDSKSSNFSHIEDIQIVARVLEGNTEAFSVLVQRHHERVYNTVYSFIGDLDEADDLAQEAFLKAISRPETISGAIAIFNMAAPHRCQLLFRSPQIQTSAQLCFSG